MARDKEVTVKGQSYLKETDFDPSSEKAPLIIWRCVSWFFSTYRKLPEPQELYGLLGSAFNSYQDCQEVSTRNLIYRYAYELFLVPINTAYAVDILQSFMYARRFRSIIFRWAEKGGQDPQGFKRVLNEMNLEISKIVPIFPCAPGYKASDSVATVSTGVAFVDSMLNGGPRPGDLIGFLAPPGGGKTVIVNQIGVEMAKAGKTFVVFHYEENLENPDFFNRIYACASNVSKSRIDHGKLNEDERDRLEESKKMIGNRLVFIDMSGRGESSSRGMGGLLEIDGILSDLENQGLKADGFGIDWFLPMANRVYASTGADKEQRLFYQDIMDHAKRVAQNRKAFCWMNHQLAPAIANKRHKVGALDASEFKSFAWYPDTCFASTMPDENGNCVLNLGKNRNGRIATAYLRLDGAHQRFIAIEEKLEWSSGLGKYVTNTSAVPSEGTFRGI